MRRPPLMAIGAVLLGAAIGLGSAAVLTRQGLLPRSPLATPVTYRNPVIGTDFADPTVLHASDGWYYAYSTEQLTVARMANIQAARSRDLVHWELLPDVLPRKPAWAHARRDFWAPGAIEAAGRFYLYFAALQDSGAGMCLGVATGSRPQGPFQPVDRPLRCGDDFVNIDPMPFDDPVSGRRLLYWGSNGSPILAQELAPDRVSFLPGSRPVEVMPPDTTAPYEHLVEAPWVVYRQGTYYLFYSGDNCCADDPAYAVMVARSSSPLGPFEKRADALKTWGASVILRAQGPWIAPGHNSVVRDAAGQDWIVYHAVNDADRLQPAVHALKRPMLIDRIVWRDGWPTISGEGPSAGTVVAPAR
ncbi:MAG: glycoside hydrolase family 43 protein [Candidatus Limnocylindria bacterium]